jgi:hypothetical protein
MIPTRRESSSPAGHAPSAPASALGAVSRMLLSQWHYCMQLAAREVAAPSGTHQNPSPAELQLHNVAGGLVAGFVSRVIIPIKRDIAMYLNSKVEVNGL